MEAEILDEVMEYLGDEVTETDKPVLLILINRAIRKVCMKRYPFGYTDEQKDAAVKRYHVTIFEAAVYYWAKRTATVPTLRTLFPALMNPKTVYFLV